MKKTLIIILLIILAAAAVTAYYIIDRPAGERKYETDASRLRQIREMVALTTLEFHEELPIKDSINGKWIVAKAKVEGAVKFDMEKLRFEERGDTTVVILPEPTLEIYESTDPGSYQVIDSWDASRPIFGRTLTAEEENTVKRRWKRRVEEGVRARGYEARARENAVATLTPLLARLRGPHGIQGPVVISDAKGTLNQ